MKLTETAKNAADKITREYGNDVMPTELVSMALRAAFGAVPDPLKLADKWESRELADSDYADGMKDCAEELRAFMRGETK